MIYLATKERTKTALKNYELKVLEVASENYNYDVISKNYKAMCNNKMFLEIISYIREVTISLPDMVLMNLNFNSLIWEFLRAECPEYVNGIYQEFKQALYKDTGIKESTSKLNNLMSFNNVMYLAVKSMKS